MYDLAEILIAVFILFYGLMLAITWAALAVNTWRDIVWPNIQARRGLRRLRDWRGGAR